MRRSIRQTERFLEKGKDDYAREGINCALGISLDLEVGEGASAT
jgi:hypothetical protein